MTRLWLRRLWVKRQPRVWFGAIRLGKLINLRHKVRALGGVEWGVLHDDIVNRFPLLLSISSSLCITSRSGLSNVV